MFYFLIFLPKPRILKLKSMQEKKSYLNWRGRGRLEYERKWCRCLEMSPGWPSDVPFSDRTRACITSAYQVLVWIWTFYKGSSEVLEASLFYITTNPYSIIAQARSRSYAYLPNSQIFANMTFTKSSCYFFLSSNLKVNLFLIINLFQNVQILE